MTFSRVAVVAALSVVGASVCGTPVTAAATENTHTSSLNLAETNVVSVKTTPEECTFSVDSHHPINAQVTALVHERDAAAVAALREATTSMDNEVESIIDARDPGLDADVRDLIWSNWEKKLAPLGITTHAQVDAFFQRATPTVFRVVSSRRQQEVQLLHDEFAEKYLGHTVSRSNPEIATDLKEYQARRVSRKNNFDALIARSDSDPVMTLVKTMITNDYQLDALEDYSVVTALDACINGTDLNPNMRDQAPEEKPDTENIPDKENKPDTDAKPDTQNPDHGDSGSSAGTIAALVVAVVAVVGVIGGVLSQMWPMVLTWLKM